MNARQSFWIMRVHQSPAFSLIFHIFSCVNYAIVDRDRQGVTGDGFGSFCYFISCQYRCGNKLKNGPEGGSGNIFLLKHTFKIENFVQMKFSIVPWTTLHVLYLCIVWITIIYAQLFYFFYLLL